MQTLAEQRLLRNRRIRETAERIVAGARDAPGMPAARLIPVEWVEELRQALAER